MQTGPKIDGANHDKGIHSLCLKLFQIVIQVHQQMLRLLYQSEAEQLVLERGLVVAEPEVPFFPFLGTSGSRVHQRMLRLNPLLVRLHILKFLE